jgi:hypothetical protein
MGVMDQGMKAWIDLCKEALLPWLVGEPVEYLGMYPKEIAPARQLLPDDFYRVRVARQEGLINIEAQTDRDDEMPRRLYEYGSRATTDSGLPVFSVALWLLKDKHGHRPKKPPYKIYFGKRLVATWEFVNIELYELTASAIMDLGQVGLLPIVPFTRDARIEVLDQAMQRVKEASQGEQAESLGALLSIFASRFHGKDVALELFRRHFMSTKIMEEFPLFRDMMAEAEAKGEAKGLAKGEAEGRAKGEAEGRARGEAEGERRIIQQVLESRFGLLPQEMLTAINAADSASLMALSGVIATASLEQLRTRLGLSG